MNLYQLSKKAAGLFAYLWSLHLNMKGKDFLFWHKYFDELKDEAYETVDRISESALQHNEAACPTIDAPELINVSIPDSLDCAITAINLFLDDLKNLNRYDIGVDNMIGDLYEKWSKISSYFLSRSV